MTVVTTLPVDITFGKVVGRYVVAAPDTGDADRLPNATAVSGTVAFMPKLASSKSTAGETTIVFRRRFDAKLDAAGQLVHPDAVLDANDIAPAADVGVWLPSGVYGVTYAFADGLTIAPHDILVTDAHDDDSPLVLPDALPPGGPILTASQYAELSARIDTVAMDTPPGGVMYSATVERPTARTDIMVIFTGPDPGSNSINGLDVWLG